MYKLILKYVLLFLGVYVLIFLSQSCTQQLHVPARDFLHDGFAENDNLGAYGYLLLTSKPSDEDSVRYKTICEVFNRTVRTVADFEEYAPSQLMVSYWPLLEQPVSYLILEDCNWLIQNYDYAKAEVVLSSIAKTHVEGPILVAWEKPFSPDSLGENYLLLDLSRFNTQDLERGIRIWKSQIIKGPEDWNDGLLYLRIKEEFRNFLERYGDSILTFVQKK